MPLTAKGSLQRNPVANVPAQSSVVGTQDSKAANLKGPDVWVKKWVDYSSKYGLGYLLSNGACGVFFNDSTKVVLDSKGHHFDYMERQGPERQDVI
jgi:polo-like kinase 1